MVAKTGVKQKQGRALDSFDFDLYCVRNLALHFKLIVHKDRQLYLMVKIFRDRQKGNMFNTPSVKPCVLCVFVFIYLQMLNC